VGNINPFRYRSYYYDTESGLYYLNARYYNPEWGRFISPDPVLDTSSAVGCNLFTYCGNDPVNKIDPTGELALLGGIAAVALVKGMIALAGLYATSILAIEIAKNPPAIPTFSWPKVKTESKSKAKDISIPKKLDLPDDTVIYRYNGTNPGNLKPKEKDIVVYKKVE